MCGLGLTYHVVSGARLRLFFFGFMDHEVRDARLGSWSTDLALSDQLLGSRVQVWHKPEAHTSDCLSFFL